MGQKVNPVGSRIGFNKIWSSHWFGSGSNFAKYLKQDAAIRALITQKHAKAGLASIEIYRSRSEVIISIHTAKPGLVIGRSGVGAQELKAQLDRLITHNLSKSDRPTVRVNILEVKNAELSAKLVAETIAGQLERRISVKRAMKQAAERTMEKRAKGIKIIISGRLGGAEIARSERLSQGSIPLQTLRSDISYALAEAKTTFGVIGIKVWIYLGESDFFPIDSATPRNQK
jgi:small subunit ribosomal protein S3